MSNAIEDTAFQKALGRFRASLTKDQREQFAGCNKAEVQKTINDIQTRHGSQRRQKNMRRVSKFVEGMSQLGQVVEVFVNADISVAFLWGPLKFMLLAANSYLDTLDLLLDTYAEIGETLPGLLHFETLYRRYPSVGKQLENYYCDVLEFNKSALEVFSRPAWKTVFRATWKTFKTNFGPILSNFRRHQKLLSEEKLTALMSEVQGVKSATEDGFKQLSKDLYSMVEQDKAKVRAEQDERWHQQRRILRDELRSPDYLGDQEHSFAILRDSLSGDWIANETIFKDWSDLSITQSPLIFLNGIPGAGKTTLVSGIVDYLLRLKETTDASGRKMSVAYFYFKHMHDDKRHLLALMRSILSQLVDQDPGLLDHVYQKVCKEHRLATNHWKELTEAAIHAQPLCFLIVDGLDECARDENAKMSETAKVLEWLKGLILSSHDCQSSSIRIFVSGQRDGVVEERLKGSPALQLENMKQHMDDIERYARDEAREICRKFSRSPLALEKDIVNRVTTASNGMFLYAKVVLDNLFMQTSVTEFEFEMEDGNFPQKLEQAYARVVERVLRNPRVPERIVAKRILGWVTCAQRPLRWREIQSLFCIDPRTGTANMRCLPSDSCKYYCSSLVDISGFNDDANEGRVELVHLSAKQFLISTDSVCLATEHAKMALFSSQYLTSRPFDARTVDEVRQYALDGYYNLHDYAVTSWWYHANESFENISSCPADILPQMIASLSGHLQQHFTAYADGTARDSTFDQVLTDFRRLSADHRTREESGSLGQRSGAIRAVLETFWASMSRELSTKNSIALQLFGPLQYKCPNSWCHFFENGFLQRTERDDHIDQHLRPFRCRVEGCYATNLGFSSRLQLQQHDKRHHQEPEQPRFSVSKKSKEYPNVWSAITSGGLGAVEAVIQKETEKFGLFNFDQRYRSDLVGAGFTALEFAANRGEYDICQYLLSAGASPVGEAPSPNSPSFPSALELALSKNDADITDMLISHYRSPELLAILETRTDKLLTDVGAEARNAFMNALELYHGGIELKEWWLMHALILKLPECVKFYYLHNDRINKRRTILHQLRHPGGLWMGYIIETSEKCLQTLLSYEPEQEVINQIFFEACATGNQLILSRLPPMQPDLSEWWAFEEYRRLFSRNHEHLESSHPLMRVIERLKPRSFWNMLGTDFRFLPLEPWIRDLDRSALRELLRIDDALLLSKDGQGSTLLHGYIFADDLDMVEFILSMGRADLNAAAFIPWESLSLSNKLRYYPIYRPEDMRDQERLPEADKEQYEKSLRPLWKILTDDIPNSMVYETAKANVTELSRKIWEETMFTVFFQYGTTSGYTPIRLALDPPTWNGKAIAHALLNSGRVDMSTGSIADELRVLLAAAKTRDNDLMQNLIQKGHSKLCPTATEDEAQNLVSQLPHNATDLLAISALESGDEIVSRELELIKHADGAENFLLIDSLVGREEFSMARKLVLQKSDNYSMGSVEREVLIVYAVGSDDVSLLQKLMSEDVVNAAIFIIAANGSSNLFNAVPRNRYEIRSVRRNDGMTPQQVAQFHQNRDVEDWLAERDDIFQDLYVDLDSSVFFDELATL